MVSGIHEHQEGKNEEGGCCKWFGQSVMLQMWWILVCSAEHTYDPAKRAKATASERQSRLVTILCGGAVENRLALSLSEDPSQLRILGGPFMKAQ